MRAPEVPSQGSFHQFQACARKHQALGFKAPTLEHSYAHFCISTCQARMPCTWWTMMIVVAHTQTMGH